MENVNLDGIRIAYTRAGSGRSAEGPGPASCARTARTGPAYSPSERRDARPSLHGWTADLNWQWVRGKHSSRWPQRRCAVSAHDDRLISASAASTIALWSYEVALPITIAPTPASG